jgi:hypothetical protein
MSWADSAALTPEITSKTVVEPLILHQVVEGAHSPPLGVPGAVNQPGKPGLNHGPCTHGAGFHRYIQGAIQEPPAAQNLAPACRIAT